MILEDTWRLVDERVSARWYLTRDQAQIRRLGRAINTILKEERLRQTGEAGEEVDQLLGADPPPQGSMAPDEGVVSGCVRLHAST